MPQRLASFVIVCVLLSPARVLGESRPSMLADYTGHGRSAALEFELGWYTESEGSESVHAFTPALSVRFAATDHFDLELDWPFAVVTTSSNALDEGTNQFSSGNPLAAGYYVSRQRDGYLRLGFGVTAPIANSDEVLSLAHGVAMRGLWDSWLYLPDSFGIVLPFQIERRMDHLILGADTAFGILIPTGDREESDAVIQLAGLVGGSSGAVSAGARLQLVWVPTSSSDNAQVSLVPFVQGDFSEGFAYLRFLVNLDEPFGVFGDGADVWGLMIGGGAGF